MGIETAIIIGLAVAQADSQIRASEAKADAIVEQGNLASKNKAQETKLKAARQQSSFLTSGLTLEGTPMNAIQGTFTTGLEDINQIGRNANRQSKAAIAEGRSQALNTMASSFAGASFGGSGSSFGSFGASIGEGFNSIGMTGVSDSIGFGLNNMGYGNDAYDMFDKIDGTY